MTAFPGVAAGAAAAAPAAELAQGVGANTAKASQDYAEGVGQYEADKKAQNFQLLFVTNTGKEVMLDHRSLAGCQRSCEYAPEMRQVSIEDAEMPVKAQTQIADSSPEDDKKACQEFCAEQFKLSCFPSESTVIARGRGRVHMASLEVGDEVLVASAGGGWEDAEQVHFEPVISFLHHAPLMKFEVLSIRHRVGTLYISPEHLLYARPHSFGQLQPALACEVHEGDEVLSLWLDGSLVLSQVMEVKMETRVGAYAPLLLGGALLVDGTVVSCYALPLAVRTSLLYDKLRQMCGMGAVAAVLHALFAPLRLAYLAALSVRCPDAWKSSRSAQDKRKGSVEACKVLQEQNLIHPYALALLMFYLASIP